MKNRKPKFSIIVPAYNSAQTLGKCLKAIRNCQREDYELIVVNDGSTDNTSEVAVGFTKNVLILPRNIGRSSARNSGMLKANGSILVFTDSDNIVPSNFLEIIEEKMDKHPEVEALVGTISKKHPNKNFFSQYKNLYMHYKFSQLPKFINFFQGDIYAIRRGAVAFLDTQLTTDDTLKGMKLSSRGKKILFEKSLQVVHLKKYNLKSILKNDFKIPFDWTQIFWGYEGWKQLGEKGTGFAHASRGQIASLLLLPTFFASLVVSFLSPVFLLLYLTILAMWILLNLSFFSFLLKEKGGGFALRAVMFTFLDHLVMFTGVVWGSLFFFYKRF